MSVKYKVVITDAQKTIRIPKGLRMLIRRSCIAALQNEEIDKDTQVNVVFVDNEHISELNKKYFDNASVVSNLVVPEDEALGCIFISVEKAVRDREEYIMYLLGHPASSAYALNNA